MEPRDIKPGWNRPFRTNNPANDLITSLKTQVEGLEQQKKPRHVIRIFYSGAFGTLRAVRIYPEGADFLAVTVRENTGAEHVIVAPVSQCSFMFSIIVPGDEESDEKVILGFAEGKTA
jgi:hypothetical protein